MSYISLQYFLNIYFDPKTSKENNKLNCKNMKSYLKINHFPEIISMLSGLMNNIHARFKFQILLKKAWLKQFPFQESQNQRMDRLN